MGKYKFLNLAHPEQSDIKFTTTTFPDGEPNIEFEKIDNKYPILIKARVCNPNDLYLLLLTTDVLNRWEAQYDVFISYLMGARMDRLMDITRPISYKIVMNLIAQRISGNHSVFDCHASKTPYMPARWFETALGEPYYADDVLLFPDQSARDRYRLAFEIDTMNMSIVVCDKTRIDDNVITTISDANINIIRNHKRVTIIDDIIDGGRTIANVIDTVSENAPNTKIAVYASHCVNKQGLLKILDKADALTTTNSYKDWQTDPDTKDNPKLKVIEII